MALENPVDSHTPGEQMSPPFIRSKLENERNRTGRLASVNMVFNFLKIGWHL